MSEDLNRRCASPVRCQGSSAHGSRGLPLLLVVAMTATGCLMAVSAIPAHQVAKQPAVDTGKDQKLDTEQAKRPEGFEVQATDGSRLRVRLLDPMIPLKTPFGTLSIPVADVHRIEFASRVPDEMAKRVADAITKLGHDEFKVREQGGAELLALGAVAYTPLLEAAKSKDPEVARRAELLLERLRETVDEQLLLSRDKDTILTENSQIAGTIQLEALHVETGLFGEQQIKLALLRRLSFGSEGNDQLGPVLPDPGTLAKYTNQIGKTMLFRVTGPAPGRQHVPVWGTGMYTLDSNLALAAVHCGAVAPGQTKVVSVTIMGPQNRFVGSNRNGITTTNWAQYPAAFVVKPAKGAQNPNAPLGLRAR